MASSVQSPTAPFQGLGVALLTFFNADKSVDLAATAQHAERLTSIGVSAILVGGTAGEFSFLSEEERNELLVAVVKQVHGSAIVIAGVGASSTRDACRLVETARDNGADCVLSTPTETTDVRMHYQSISEAASDLPVLAYHWPAKYPPGVPVDLIDELPIAGCKDSSGDPKRLLDAITTTTKALYIGSSSLTLLAGAVGANGVLLGQANAYPELCLQAFSGDGQAQTELHATQDMVRNLSLPRKLKQMTAERFGTSTTSRS